MHSASKLKIKNDNSTFNRKEKTVNYKKQRDEIINISQKHLHSKLSEYQNLKQTMSKLLVKQGIFIA